MLSISCYFSRLSSINVQDAISLLIKYKDIEKYIKSAQPAIPITFYRNAGPYQIKISGEYESTLSQFKGALTPHQLAILQHFQKWSKVEHIGLKYNIALVDNNHPNKDTALSNTFYAINESVDFISSLNENFYIDSEHSVPQDKQTILSITSKFNATNKICKTHGSKRIYKSIRNKTYCYLDNFHKGNKAHIEVFSEHGNYLGEMNLYCEYINSIQANKSCNNIP